MFGTLRPHSCGLSQDEQQQHQRFYCGLCKTLGDEYSQPLRATLTFDAVFLGILGDAMMREGASPSSCRCPLLPIAHRPTISPKSPAMRYAAAVQMLLADQWLADHAMEGKTFARLARPVLKRPVDQARQILKELDVDLDALEGFEQHQHDVEQQKQTGPMEAAYPTAWALGIVFRTMTALPGVAPAFQQPENLDTMQTLGEAVGRIIYLTDALDDLREDWQKGAFNPCLRNQPTGDQYGLIDIDAIQHTCKQLEEDLNLLSSLLRQLPWERHQTILQNILLEQGRRAFQQARQDAQGLLQAEERRQLRQWHRRPWIDRWSTTVTIAVIAWLTWFQHLLAEKTGPPGGEATNTGFQISPIGAPEETTTSCFDSCGNSLCSTCLQPLRECMKSLTKSCNCATQCNEFCTGSCNSCTKTCTNDCCQNPCGSCTKDLPPCCKQMCGGECCKNCGEQGSSAHTPGC